MPQKFAGLSYLLGDKNFLDSPCPKTEGAEIFDLIFEHPPFLRLERIHSNNARSAENFWYDQTEYEWVTILKGSAKLMFEDEETARVLQKGDSVLI